MKTKKRSYLSMLLVLSLLLSQVLTAAPIGKAASNAAKITYQFNFNNYGGGLPEGYSGNLEVSSYTEYGTSESGFWKYAAHSISGGNTLTVRNSNTYLMFGEAGDWVAYRIKGVNKGRYMLSANCSAWRHAGAYEFFLVPINTDENAEGVVAALTADDLVGQENFYYPREDDGAYYEARNIGEGFVAEQTGEYLFVLRLKEKGAINGYLRLVEMTLSPVRLVADSYQLEQGDKINVYLGDQGVPVNVEETVKFTSSDETILTVDSTGCATARDKAGVATITAVITETEESFETQIRVLSGEHTGQDHVYQLNYNYFGAGRPASAGLSVTEYEVYGTTTTGVGYWKYAASMFEPTTTSLVKNNSIYTVFKTDGEWLALRIKGVKKGRYDVDVRGSYWQNAGINEFYLIPVVDGKTDFEIAASLPNADMIGAQDFYLADMAGANYNDFRLDGVFDAEYDGEYIFVVRVAKRNSSGTCLFHLCKLTLVPQQPKLHRVMLSASSGLTAGDSAQISITGRKTDGEIISLNEMSPVFTVSDPSVATVSESGVVKGLAPGIVTVTASVAEGEAILSGEMQIEVNNPDAHAEAEFIALAEDAEGADVSAEIECDIITDFQPGTRYNHGIGTNLTLTASDTAEKQFLYWRDTVSQRILSTNKTYNFSIGSGTSITAVYRGNPDSGKVLVEFLDRNGKVLQSSYVNSGTTVESVKPLTDPYSVGYSFGSWSKEDSETLISDSFILAQYDADETAAGMVTVVNGCLDGELTENTYGYNNKVTVTADPAPEGKVFAYWEKDGQAVSYSREYSFYVWADTVLTAVYMDTAPIQVPRVVMDSTIRGVDSGRAAFMAERTVPADCRIIESGILLSTSNQAPTLSDYQIIARANSATPNGQFTVRRDNVAETWYARAYIIYEKDNVYRVAYSNVVNN